MFSEYVAFLPITALVLAVLGAWQWRRRPGVLAALALTAVGLFLALGVFNPLYWLPARLPGFDLFRVPARWLALYASARRCWPERGWRDCGLRIADCGFSGGGTQDAQHGIQKTDCCSGLLLLSWV
ncbi:hypothetical protein [Candidatus Amarobacter glycogenicus]|uniref:hypothetical protein n=1 Tax=Candidatus Amarobacter glycogenicus TaxID=3140699 RepID=UPI002A178668|nr:hypothetical protein [Dehalococcoidia bacterium]